MKYHLRSKPLSILFTILLLNISCHQDSVSDEIDLLDTDMIVATDLAETYLNSANGRNGSEKSITVFKFKEGKLLFNTNTDDIYGYQEVDEDTFTAFVEPGEHIFWYSGGGLTDLDGIEFDDDSQGELDEFPEEINEDKMWVITVPDDIEDDEIDLKYDILYEYKGYDGPPIRLDPKIKIQPSTD